MALINRSKNKIVVYKGDDTFFLIPYGDEVIDTGITDLESEQHKDYEDEIVKGFDDTVTVSHGEHRGGRVGGPQGGIAKGESIFQFTDEVFKSVASELKQQDSIDKLKTFQSDVKDILKEAVEEAKKAEKKVESIPYTIYPVVNQKPHETEHEVNLGSIGEYKKIYSSIYSQVATIQKWLHRLINDKRYARWMGNKYAGRRLNRKVLHTIPMGNRDIFMIKEEIEILNIAFSLLIDESGSMYGDKALEARNCGIMFGELLNKIGVPFEIIGFTTTGLSEKQKIEAKKVQHLYKDVKYNRTDNLRHNIYKRFDDSFLKVRTKLVHIAAHDCNFDQDHIEFTWERLKARREKKKVLIVVSDSQPCGGEAARHKLKRVVNEIGCHPGAEVIGIGIKAPYMKEFYHKFVDIDNVQQLGMNVVRLIKAAFEDAAHSKRIS